MSERSRLISAISTIALNESVVALQAQDDEALLAELSQQPAAAGCWLLCADSPAPLWSSFAPLRPLLAELTHLVRPVAPELILSCAPELAAILPEVAAWPETQPYVPLESLVQLPLAEARTLSQESEYAFRIISRLGWFISGALKLSAAQQQGRAIIVFHGLEQLDRPTLLAIFHLCLRARAGHFTLLLLGDLLTGDDHVSASSLFDTSADRRILISRMLRKVAARPLVLDGEPRARSVNGAAGRGVDAAVHDLGQESLPLRAGCPPVSRLEQAAFLARRSLNHEALLYLAQATLSNPALDASLAAYAWQVAGTAHAALDHYSEALDCFQRGVSVASGVLERARLAMFLALIHVKRLDALAQASRMLNIGRDCIAGLTTAEAVVERAWLENVAALVAYRQHNLGLAADLVQNAIQMLRPLDLSAADGLMTNLVTNLSIVYETAGRYDQALAVWHLFQGHVKVLGSVFAKHFHYREAILLLKSGRLPCAFRGFEQAFAAAQHVGDLVCMAAAAQACSLICYRTGDFSTALCWAELIPQIVEELGDEDQLGLGWVLIAACHATLNDLPRCREALSSAARLLATASQTKLAGLAGKVLGQVDAGERSKPEIDWFGLFPALPESFYRWPSSIIIPPA